MSWRTSWPFFHVWPNGVLVVGGIGFSKPDLPINLHSLCALADSHNRGWYNHVRWLDAKGAATS